MGSLKVESGTVALQPGARKGGEPANSTVRTRQAGLSERRREPMGLAYAGLVLFMIVYCLRPEDWIPVLVLIPLAKICAFLAILGFLYSWMTQGLGGTGFPRELIYLVLLFAHLVLCIPFAVWRGGSFQLVFLNFSEVVILTIVLALGVRTVERLRRLVFIQTVSVAAITVLALVNNRLLHDSTLHISRMMGAGSGVFENPNDLAVGIAIVFPLCFVFLLRAQGFFRKALWTLVLLVLARALLFTYSRGGLLSLLAALLVTLYEFGIKRRRPHLLLIAALAVGLFIAFAGPANYGERMTTILDPDSDSLGSAQARRRLLMESLETTKEHPIFGIGPGDFQIISGFWHETHNTYTQLSAEAGIPALLLFLLIFGRSFKNIKRARALAPDNEEIQMLGAGLRGSIVAYLVGSFFSSTAYLFFPYFLVAFSSALHVIARQQRVPEPEPGVSVLTGPLRARNWRRGLAGAEGSEPWARGALES